MADAFGYLADAIVSIVLFFFLLRFLLQLSRADFRNPIARGTTQLTNWLVLPLRKLLPPLGRVDTASVVAVLLIAGAGIGIASLIAGVGLPPADVWLIRTLRMLASNILLLYLLAILVGVAGRMPGAPARAGGHRAGHALSASERALEAPLPPSLLARAIALDSREE